MLKYKSQEGVLDAGYAAYLTSHIRTVGARKAGDAVGEKDCHFYDNPVSGIRTSDMVSSESNVAVHPC